MKRILKNNDIVEKYTLIKKRKERHGCKERHSLSTERKQIIQIFFKVLQKNILETKIERN
jgi:hypothetical protein